MAGVMKNNNFKSVLAAALSALALFATGCVGTPDGGTKAGIPFVYKDTRTVRYQRSVEQVTAASRIVLTRNGRLQVDNVVNNTFKARINERTVFVKVTKVDDKTTELVVMARTALGADIDLAAELDKQIALQLTVIP
jgi:hypothetical protein